MSAENPAQSVSQTVSLADEEAVKQVLVAHGLRPLGHRQRFDPASDRPSAGARATIFGSARAQPGTYVYDEVKRVATALAEMGCDIITGGGPGLMQAANEGAAAADASRA